MFKYYVGYFHKPWDATEFTVILGCNTRLEAQIICKMFNERGVDSYKMISAAEAMELKLIL